MGGSRSRRIGILGTLVLMLSAGGCGAKAALENSPRDALMVQGDIARRATMTAAKFPDGYPEEVAKVIAEAEIEVKAGQTLLGEKKYAEALEAFFRAGNRYDAAIAVSSEAYRMALKSVQDDPQVKAAIGTDIKPDRVISGGVSTKGDRGEAILEFTVTGTKGTATVTAQGTQVDGRWGLPDLRLHLADGQRIKVKIIIPDDEGELPFEL